MIFFAIISKNKCAYYRNLQEVNAYLKNMNCKVQRVNVLLVLWVIMDIVIN